MHYRKMNQNDLDQVIDIYMAYYNQVEGRAWTYETAYKRINPILTRQDAFCMVCEKNHNILGFVLGYYEQYDDLFAYTLDEIVISKDHQRKGLGTDLMFEIENMLRKKALPWFSFMLWMMKCIKRFMENWITKIPKALYQKQSGYKF